jgi:hypothetical protein
MGGMEADTIKSYVKDLFKYLETYEKNYSQFKTEAFFQTYNGIYAVFQALREQRNKAVELDYVFLDGVRETPLTESDLRQVTVQVLITFFESEADTDGRSNQAYSHCRGIRPVKQDVPFFEKHLLPVLFKESCFKENFRLISFFLNEIARYLNKFGKRIQVDLPPEKFNAMSDQMKFLELARRRLDLGTDLLKDRESLEFHLQRVDAFTKLKAKGRVYRQHLSEWQYLKRRDFWSKVKSWLGEFGGKFRGAFSSGRYLRLVLSQRNPAYLTYTVIVILFLTAAVAVPILWNKHYQKRLQDFRERAEEVQRRAGG